MTLTSVCKDVWRIILSHLTLKEYASLKLSNKKINTMVLANEDTFVKVYYHQLVSNQDVFLTTFYQNPTYLAVLYSQTAKNVQSQDFEDYKNFMKAKLLFADTLKTFAKPEKCLQVMESLKEAFSQPYLRPLPLRRESECLETFSLFQNHLNDVHFKLDPESLSLLRKQDSNYFDSEELMALKSIQEESKEFLRQARWYLKPDLHADSRNYQDNTTKAVCQGDCYAGEMNTCCKPSYIVVNKGSRKVPPLLDLYSELHELISSYCRVISNFLNGIDSPMVFAVEYTTRWKNFTLGMQQISTMLRDFSSAINEKYYSFFKNDPKFPCFSIWRMMTRIWYKEVYHSLETRMNSEFNKLVECYLVKCTTNFKDIDISTLSNIDSEIFNNSLEVSEIEFATCINEFWQAIIDLGFNEKTVPYLNFADLRTIRPISGFCVSLHEIVSQRGKGIIEDLQCKPHLKFNIICEFTNLIESIVSCDVFPELYQLLADFQKKLLSDVISQVNGAAPEEIDKLLAGDENKSLHSFVSSEEIVYPTLFKQIICYKKHLQSLDMVQRRRETYINIENPPDNNPEISNLENLLLDYDKSIEIRMFDQLVTQRS